MSYVDQGPKRLLKMSFIKLLFNNILIIARQYGAMRQMYVNKVQRLQAEQYVLSVEIF